MPHQPANLPSRVPGSAETLHEVDLFSRANPRSVINLVPDVVGARIFAAGKDREDLFRLPERELKKAVSPTPTDNRLRLAFWNEYNAAQSAGTAMEMKSVYAGVCTHQYFYNNYLFDAGRVAWLLCPPAAYTVALEEILNTTSDKLREIVDAPIFDPKSGKIDVKLGELILKIHQTVENRLKGATIQRTEIRSEVRQQSVNYNVNADDAKAAKDVAKVVESESMEEVERRIAAIRAKKAAAERATRGHVTEGEIVEPGDEQPPG